MLCSLVPTPLAAPGRGWGCEYVCMWLGSELVCGCAVWVCCGLLATAC